jgi:hypothetical protein
LLAVIVVALLGCGSRAASAPAADPATPAAAPAGAESPHPLDWMLGAWANKAGDSGESWVRVGDVLVGLGWSLDAATTAQYEIMIVHRLDGPTVYTAMPGGAQRVEFTQTKIEDGLAEFGNPEHDHPKIIRYRSESAGELHTTIEGGGPTLTSDLARAELIPAEILHGEDRAFDDDAAARGGDAWAERFAADGAMWPRGSARIVGPPLIKVAIDDLRAGGRTLRWEPSTGAMSPAGDLGITAGPYRIEEHDETIGTGVYVTVWRRTTDGAWQIIFDTGV